MASIEPLHYRLEVQFVLAFHESMLLGRRVEKNIPDQIRAALPSTQRPDLEPSRAYNSWGVYSDDGSLYRPYENEPVQIARTILKSAGVAMNAIVLEHGPQNQDFIRFEPWHISAEPGLPGVGSAGLLQHFRSCVTPENVDQWDSYGLSAFSQAFTAFVRGRNKDELNDLTFGVKGVKADGRISPRYGAFVTNLTGLYVRIDPPMNLGVLRELAFILLVYEDEINRLHPPYRQVGHPSTRGILRSNRFDLLRLPNAIMRNESIDLNRPDRLSNFVDLVAIRTLINDADGDTLLNVMGNQGNELVSWRRSADLDDGSITVVFRQHQGSLDAMEIAAWASFTTNLIRVAERFHAQGGCPVREWEDHISVFTLMDGLTDQHVEYFRRRIALYMNYQENRSDYVTDSETPPGSQDTGEAREGGDEVPGRDVGIPGEETAGEKTGFPGEETEFPGEDTGNSGEEMRTFSNSSYAPDDEPVYSGDAESDGAEGTTKKRPATEQPLEDPHVPKKQRGRSRVMPGSAVPQQTYRPGDIIPFVDASKQNIILYEAGTIANEDMIYLNRHLYVRNYIPSDWEVLHTPENGSDNDRSLPYKCGIWALLNSLHYQYENDPAVTALDYQQVYQAVQYESSDERNGGLRTHETWSRTYSPMELARGLRTLGRFKLVTCSEAGEQFAVRIAPVHELVQHGRNVYLQDGNSSGQRSAHLHWSAMRRLKQAYPLNRPGSTSSTNRPSTLATYGFTPIDSRPSAPANTSEFTLINMRPFSSANTSGFTPINNRRSRRQDSFITISPPRTPEIQRAVVSGTTPPVTSANPRNDEGWGCALSWTESVYDTQPIMLKRNDGRKALVKNPQFLAGPDGWSKKVLSWTPSRTIARSRMTEHKDGKKAAFSETESSLDNLSDKSSGAEWWL